MAISTGSVAPQRSTSLLSGTASGNVAAGRSSQADRAVASRIDTYLRGQGSPLAGKGQKFVDVGKQYGVNPVFLAAIAGAETDFGKYGPSQRIYNPFGLGPGMRFPSWDRSIEYAARNLATNPAYRGKDTIDAIATSWAPQGASNDPTNLNTHWPNNVKRFYRAIIGQDPINGRVKWPPGSAPEVTLGAGSVLDDAVGAVVPDVIENPVKDLVGLLKFIADPKMWVRVGSMILGAAAMIVGIVMVARSSDAGRPIGLMLASVGFVWLYASVKAINPADMLKGLVGA